MASLGKFRAYMNADCKGDKVKLPESVSQRLLSIPNITYPLCFELSVPISREEILNAMQLGLPKPQRQSIYCGVLDFTAGEGCICLPQWIMENMGISDNDMLTVNNLTLPKGRAVKLQPHTLLKDVKTKQQLEAALRNFTTLTANTTITIQSMNNLKLNVLDVKPNKNDLNSIQIIDTDLVVEFEAPADGSTETTEHYEHELVLNQQSEKQHVVEDKVGRDSYRFYKLRILDGVDNVQITVAPKQKHDVDLYASWKHYEPGTSTDNYDYHCVETGAAQIIVNVNDAWNKLDENTANANKKDVILYVSVHGFDAHASEHKDNDNEEEIEYTLEVKNISLDEVEKRELYRASSLEIHDETAGGNVASNTNTNDDGGDQVMKDMELPLSTDPDKQFCTNCHRFVNKWSYDRHHQHCVKQFYFCAACKKVIKLEELESHNKTLHNNLKCKMCNETISGGKQTLLSHQKYECLQRPVSCKYCHLPFAYIAHSEHEEMCGARTELCPYCNERIALSLIQDHTIDVHGMQYEAPSGIARMQSDASDAAQAEQMALGGWGTNPERNYADMHQNDGDELDRSKLNERWICSSCDYNNRPNHNICKICKTKRTKYMKTVSDAEKGKIVKKPKKKEVDKIGGSGLIPQRNYDDMLKKEERAHSNNEQQISVQPPLIQYNAKQNAASNEKSKAAAEPVASGIDPSLIPQRDYAKMLKNEEIDDSAAFIAQQPDDADNEDVQMMQMDDTNNKDKYQLSSNVENIPQRDYDAMLNQPDEVDIDPVAEQQALIEQMRQQMTADSNANKADREEKTATKTSYRSDTVVIPQRNYDKMFASNDNDVSMAAAVPPSNSEAETKKVASTSTGYWLCPSETCEHLNKSTRYDCSVCHTLKPTYKRTAELLDDGVDQLGLQHRWVCKNCNGLNKGSRRKCVYCHEMKAYEPSSKSAAKKQIESSKRSKIADGIFNDVERWVCPNKECNFLNKGSRLNCQVCHTQRKDTSILWGNRANKMNSNPEKGKGDNGDKQIETQSIASKPAQTQQYAHPLEARMMQMDEDQLQTTSSHAMAQNSHNSDNNNNNNHGNDNSAEWQCPICTFLNKTAQCEMCGCPKDAQ